jgi:nitrate/TMAO reductase-like tetraheme cytochrome c subunit
MTAGAMRAAMTFALLGLPAGAILSAQERAPDRECLSCHGDRGLELVLADGEKQTLFVDHAALAGSVHKDLGCADCHPAMAKVPHPSRPYRTRAEFRAGFREACKSCHFENYRQSFDSVHQKLLARGDVHAPSCIECHGAHGVAPAGQPRSAISRTCATCHEGISASYARSVHGRALLETDNKDVPVCTDCHRGHAIADPRSDAWLLGTPELCGSCHTDAEVMGRYGLSTDVLQTYLADFHGVTASLSKGRGQEGGRLAALCIDCHGVHDIGRVDGPGSPALKANLVKTCRGCHPGATENFPAAWLSHYPPSWRRAPLVYGVKVFYWVFIPFVIGGLLLQIVLHLWRVAVNR